MENFKRQSWKIKLEKWHEPNYKSAITGFYTVKNSNLLGVLPEVTLWDIDFGAFSLFIILENTLATGCLYSLNELTVWQVCVTSVSEPIYRESGKTLSDEESPRYEVSENNSRFDESTTHKSTLLILMSVSFLNQCCFFP